MMTDTSDYRTPRRRTYVLADGGAIGAYVMCWGDFDNMIEAAARFQRLEKGGRIFTVVADIPDLELARFNI